MQHQRLIAPLLFVSLVATLAFANLSFTLVSVPEQTVAVCRAPGHTHLQDIEDDAYLAAVQAEVTGLYASNPDATMAELMGHLRASHQNVHKVAEVIEYFYEIDSNGVAQRVCRLRRTIAVNDPAQIVPVYVEVDVTVDV